MQALAYALGCAAVVNLGLATAYSVHLPVPGYSGAYAPIVSAVAYMAVAGVAIWAALRRESRPAA